MSFERVALLGLILFFFKYIQRCSFFTFHELSHVLAVNFPCNDSCFITFSAVESTASPFPPAEMNYERRSMIRHSSQLFDFQLNRDPLFFPPSSSNSILSRACSFNHKLSWRSLLWGIESRQMMESHLSLANLRWSYFFWPPLMSGRLARAQSLSSRQAAGRGSFWRCCLSCVVWRT